MKIGIGSVALALSTVSAGALLITMVRVTFCQLPGPKGFMGFFGFGLPMVLTAAATSALWPKEKKYVRILGGTSAAFGAAYVFCVLSIVGWWVFGTSTPDSPSPGIWHFMGMLVLMVVSGGFAVGVLGGAVKPD